MTNANYCKACKETLTIHADGSITCNCEMLGSEEDKIPKSWVLTKEELKEAREAEAQS